MPLKNPAVVHDDLTTTPGDSIADRIRRKYGRRKSALLFDTSGSMEKYTKRLQELADKYQDCTRYQFNSEVTPMPPGFIVDCDGTTNLTDALKFVKLNGHRHIILITDGHPDEEGTALVEANGMVIDIIYTGPPPAPPFLKKLAGYTGGSYDAVSIEDLMIETKITGLLGPGGGSTIQL